MDLEPIFGFDVLLAVHLSIFILVINQLGAPIGGRPVHRCTGRPPIGMMIPDAVQYNFDLLTMSTWCSKHVEV